MISNFIKYLTSIKGEFPQIKWASQGEVISSCILVIIVSMILGSFLFLVDLVIMKLVSFIFF